MTEAEWLACNDPDKMLYFLGVEESDRKLRLFACALGRRLWGRFNLDAVRHAVEFAERVADGLALATPQELLRVQAVAHRAIDKSRKAPKPAEPNLVAMTAAASAGPSGMSAAAGAAGCAVNTGLRKAGVAAALREVFGNPLRPLTLDPACRTPLVVSLAQAAYDERILPSGELEPARLAVLADALEEAGCTNEEILTHLRSPGPHVRGCWALDLILGKS